MGYGSGIAGCGLPITGFLSLEIERDIDRASAVGEGADADKVDAGLGDGADVIDVDAAAGLGSGAPRDELNGFTELGGRHVVEEDDVGTRIDGLSGLLELIGFHFDHELRGKLSRARDCDCDGIGFVIGERGKVIVFNQNLVVETEPVVFPPPHSTAYFSKARQPGVVLRVSRIWALVPRMASTNLAVRVATPERR